MRKEDLKLYRWLMMHIRLLIIFIIMNILSHDVLGSEETHYKCDFDGIKTIELPLYPDRPISSKFSYRYQVIGEANPEEPTIIYLPGGPGGSSINNYHLNESKDYLIKTSLPDNETRIFIDPRTSGCNQGDEKKFPDDSLRSEYLASDVIAVIRELRLKKYILFGHSYGSQWATFIAGQAEKEGIPTPHALVLSGIIGLGKADGTLAISYNLSKEWDALREKLSEETLSILDTSTNAPLGFDSSAWALLIVKGLYKGSHYIEGKLRHVLQEQLLLLDSNDPIVLKPLTDMLKQYSPTVVRSIKSFGRGDYSDRLFEKIDCHEISPDDVNTTFSYGRIIRNPDDITCEKEVFDRPYDSGTLLTTAPIYYIAGENDPATPYTGAFYHFEHQVRSRRNFIKVPGGGHNKIGLNFPDCLDKIWNSIFQQEDLDKVLKSCKSEVELSIR